MSDEGGKEVEAMTEEETGRIRKMLESREVLAERQRHAKDAKGRIAELEAAIDSIRDAVLHNRFQLAEMEVDSEVINAVLGIIDDHDPRPLQT